MRLYLLMAVTLAGCSSPDPQASVRRAGRTGDMDHRVEVRPNHAIVFVARRTGSGSYAAVFEEQCRKDAAALALQEARRVVANPGMDPGRIQSSVRRGLLSDALTCTVTIPIINYAVI